MKHQKLVQISEKYTSGVTSVICGLVIELIAQKVFNTQCASIATMLPDDADSVCRDIFIGLSMD